MKKFLLIFSTILILFFVNNLAIGQNKTTTKENLPSRMYSLEKNSIDKITIQPLAKSYISNITSQNEKDGTAYKVASSLSVDLTTENSGSWDYLENGAKIWRIKLSSEGAKAAVLLFDWFDLPDKAKMFVYCDNSDIVLGPYTFENNPSGEEYAIGIIPSQDVYIEYYVNSQNAKSIRPHFKISSYDYFFRGEAMFDENAKANEYNNSENCEVNINCPEGANWQTQKKGVCKYYIDNGICSGTLVNNTSNDGTPYVLSANHCGGNISASKFNQCVFFFNYESPGCSNSYVAPQTTFTGCTKKSTGAVSGGTDFLLVQLNNATALQIKNANLVYNGWDKSGTASPNGVSIHHPAGDNKKISTYTSTLTTSTFNSSSSNKHWLANWVQTQTNYGVTEGGSSGSPLFNNNGLVVGTLSGGSSSCTTSTSNKNDLYGKFSEHWSNSVNGSGNGAKLQPWLDPNSTGANTCPYYDPNSVTANFSGTPTTVNVGGTVQFTDNSIIQGTGITRSWIFAGGTPGTSTATNPTVTYNTAGTYYVSLTVSSSAGSNTKTITNYITVLASSTLTSFTYDFEACTNFVKDNFSPCITYDGDGGASGSFSSTNFTNEGYTGAFIAMNPSACSPSMVSTWAAHGGNKFGACAYSTSAPNNDWFILPRILVQGNATFSFWARSFNSSFLESFKVMISTTGNTYSDFIQLPSANYSNIATTWTQYTYNLQNYAGQNVYLAIVCTSNDKYLFGIDDIQVVAGAVTPTKDANFTADNTNISVGGTVHFTDQSTVNGTTITGRSWEFPGGTPASSTATNPSIVYNTVGTYNVSLTITTGAGNDTETKNGYITVSTGGTTMTSFTYDFEACANFVLDNFSPCETYDGDGKATYSSENFDFTNEGYTGSYIAMNPSATTPSMSGNANWAAHLGNKYGACFSAIAPPNNDWFILPKLLITTNSEFSFWAKSVTNQYELERFDVLISSNNEQFSIISAGAYIEAPTTWTKYTYSLSSYAGQEMYLAIRCVSNNAFVFAIDDISVSSTMIVAENLNLPNINVFPNPSIGEFTVLAPEKSVISIYDISGKHIQTLTSSNATTNIHIQVAGVYFVNIKTEKGIKTERLIVE